MKRFKKRSRAFAADVMTIHIKRIYDPAEPTDGFRVLTDRLWPRGVTKAEADVDRWTKDLAPSTELRTWFHSDRARFDSFRGKYRKELNANRDAVRELIAKAGDRNITLLTAAREPDRSHAVVLRDMLIELSDQV